jgi:hypothetical protein
VITLGEEELSDVSLSKFFVYDRETTRFKQARPSVRPKVRRPYAAEAADAAAQAVAAAEDVP